MYHKGYYQAGFLKMGDTRHNEDNVKEREDLTAEELGMNKGIRFLQ